MYEIFGSETCFPLFKKLYGATLTSGSAFFYHSKVLVYQFHYDYTKRKYGPTAKLVFTDTDSLRYEVKTDDIF